ncbi:MAG: hypothetical protein RLZZ15_3638 [Verrucomicrobiota bacterium]|jgi:uncharacterized protein (DUF1697 family)
MTRYIAFLRGINLGRRRIRMEDLRARFAELKFTEIETFIASGNVLFACPARDARKLATQIEAHLAATLGYAVDTVVRTRAEVAALAVFQPFAEADMDLEKHVVHCAFLRAPLPATQARGLAACGSASATDAFRVEGREFFWLYRGLKSSDSTIWSTPEVRALKLPTSSMRNLATLRRLTAEFPP